MSRMSPEARAAAAQRAGGKYPIAPAGISSKAQKIWRDVVTSKPIDWFDAGSLVLLRSFCVLAADAEELQESLLHVGRRDDASIDELRKSALALTTLATKLRLTVQANVEWESRKIEEKGSKRTSLLGGNVVRFDPPG